DSADDRWRQFPIHEVTKRLYNLDGLRWLRDEESDDEDNNVDPEDLLAEAVTELNNALTELAAMQRLVSSGAAE
ncbi:MAG TPA: hypothetical protein VGR71_00510, partial [Nitrospira sp.]|nr:hypothetical protein [Nitrospira sp.]